MNTSDESVNSNSQMCSHMAKKHKVAYRQGVNALHAGLEADVNPYVHGSSLSREKRIAWFTGYYDEWRKQRKAYYENCRANSNIRK